MAEQLQSILLELERAGWESLCNSTGSEFYGAVMLPDALMVVANGMVLDRAAVVSSLSQSPPWHSYDISDVRLVEVDADTAILVYTGSARRDDAPPFVAAMASTYHRTENGWRLVLYQQTPIPDN
ncbi:nuclear transport factor 2 family protein [Mycolicibacterium sp. XJ1819]